MYENIISPKRACKFHLQAVGIYSDWFNAWDNSSSTHFFVLWDGIGWYIIHLIPHEIIINIIMGIRGIPSNLKNGFMMRSLTSNGVIPQIKPRIRHEILFFLLNKHGVLILFWNYQSTIRLWHWSGNNR